MVSAKGLKDVPSEPEGRLQNKATRMLISLSQYIIKESGVLQKKSLWDKIVNCNVVESTYFLVSLCFL